MESNGDDVLANDSDATEKDQTLISPLDQDQEGDGEGKKAKPETHADYDGTIYLLLNEIRALEAKKLDVEFHLDDARKKLHQVEADNRSIAAHANCLEGKLVHARKELAAATAASRDFEAEVNRLKRALKDLGADKANLADANAMLEGFISSLEVPLLAAPEGNEVDLLALRTKNNLLEKRVTGLSEDVWHSKEQAEAAVKEQVMIREALEEDVKQVVKVLKETKTRLEREIAGVLSQIERHLEIQSKHDAAVASIARGLKFSWVVAAVASVGALAVVAVTVYLRNVRQRSSGAREL